jgi:cobalt/nickel transport system permease protein
LHTASAIMTAQEARLGNKDYRTQIRSFGKMSVSLFLISFRKANAMYDAMEARGYDGTVKVLRSKQQVKRKEIFLLAVFEILLMICAAAERMML